MSVLFFSRRLRDVWKNFFRKISTSEPVASVGAIFADSTPKDSARFSPKRLSTLSFAVMVFFSKHFEKVAVISKSIVLFVSKLLPLCLPDPAFYLNTSFSVRCGGFSRPQKFADSFSNGREVYDFSPTFRQIVLVSCFGSR